MSIRPGPRFSVPYRLIEGGPLRFLAALPAMLLRDHGATNVKRAILHYRGPRLVGWQAFYGSGGESILSFNGRRVHVTRESATLLGATDMPRGAPDRWVAYEPEAVPGRGSRSRWHPIAELDAAILPLPRKRAA